jgi:hypothetical protein
MLVVLMASLKKTHTAELTIEAWQAQIYYDMVNTPTENAHPSEEKPTVIHQTLLFASANMSTSVPRSCNDKFIAVTNA